MPTVYQDMLSSAASLDLSISMRAKSLAYACIESGFPGAQPGPGVRGARWPLPPAAQAKLLGAKGRMPWPGARPPLAARRAGEHHPSGGVPAAQAKRCRYDLDIKCS